MAIRPGRPALQSAAVRGPQRVALRDDPTPVDLELEKVKSMIDNLPLDDEPEVFGLHENANITC